MKRRFESRYAGQDTVSEPARLAFKDGIALLFSGFALLLTIVGIYFNFYRNNPSLKMVATQFKAVIDPPGWGSASSDLQEIHYNYDIVFVNDGNKPILVTLITHKINSIEGNSRDTVESVFDSFTSCAPRGASTQNAPPNLSSDIEQIRNIIIKPGEFTVQKNLDVGSDKYDILNVTDRYIFLSCLDVYYIRPDGITGMSEIPATVFRIKQGRNTISVSNRFTASRLHAVVP